MKVNPSLSAAVLAGSLVGGVYAQESAELALEEVIVTAQKKAESLQDTPISLTAFGQEDLETKGINNLNDIGSKVPSLTIEPFPINQGTLRIFIRGIGIADVQVTQDPPVGIYVDGVYIARSTGTALDVADLERIEILRGPQGTLYGRNTTGGAINMVTRRPNTDALEFSQKFTVGNRNLFSSKTALNVPITDTFAAKLAYLTTENDGFVENTGPGGDFGDREVQGYRVDLRWDASETLTVDYAYDNSSFEYYNSMYQAITPAVQNKGQAEPIKDTAVANAKFSSTRFDEMASGPPFEESNTDIEGHAIIVTKDFDQFQLKYIGAYRELYDAAYADLGGGIGSLDYRLDSNYYDGTAAASATGGPTPLTVPQITQEQFSHELQFTGYALEERLEYIVGLYYFEEEAEENNYPQHLQLTSPIDTDLIPLLGPILLGAGDVRISNLLAQKYNILNESYAAFGQATWTPEFTEDRLHLTMGVRYSNDYREALKNQIDETYITVENLGMVIDAENPLLQLLSPALASAGFMLPGDRRFDNIFAEKEFDDISFSFVAEYDLTDDINVYGKAVEAYKSGGFNTRDPQRGATGDPATDDSDEAAADGVVYGFGFVDGFEEEKVTSYELGLKGEFMNRRLRVNADVFLSEYVDQQLNFILQGTVADTKVTNAGESEMRGFETDITFLATHGLLFTFNYAYLDAEVTKATDAEGNDVADELVFFSAPEQSYTATMDWGIKQFDWGLLSLNVSYNYMAERNGGARKENVRNTYLRAYDLWNARLSLNDIPVGEQGNLNIGLWSKNLADEEYEITAVDNLPHADRAVLWGEPRTYGLDVIYRY